jgi:hypothetical protein
MKLRRRADQKRTGYVGDHADKLSRIRPLPHDEDERPRRDVDVQQLAGPALLVAIGRLRWPEPGEPAEPDPGEDPRHRRERHPQRQRDLLAAEAQPPEAGDRLQPLLGRAVRLTLGGRRAIGKARLPLGAVASTHLQQVRSLTPAASAASPSDHSTSTTRRHITSRPFGLSLALAWSFIRCPPRDWWLRHHPASKQAPDEQRGQVLQLARGAPVVAVRFGHGDR